MNHDDKVRLFRASTLMVRYRGHKEVIFHWLMLNRAQSVAPYERLIAGYRDLDRLEQLHLENFVDESFTEQEITLLAAYLKKRYQWELAVEEVTLPIHDANLANPNAFPALSSQQLLLSNKEGYDLPFQVYGLFDLSQHEPSDEEQEEDYLGFGLLYLRETLKVLGIVTETDDERFSDAKLVEVVMKLRQEHGLWVSSAFPQGEQDHPLPSEGGDYFTYLLDRS